MNARLCLISLLSLAGCPSPEADDSGASVDTAATSSGDDSGAEPSTVAVTYSVWTAETGCWQRETADLDYTYWWPYGEGSGVVCEDVQWYVADGARCLLFSYHCTQTDPSSDPTLTSTTEEQAACEEAVAGTEAGSVPACE